MTKKQSGPDLRVVPKAGLPSSVAVEPNAAFDHDYNDSGVVSEDYIALKFVEVHLSLAEQTPRIRYLSERKAWYVWNQEEGVWKLDRTWWVFNQVREYIRHHVSEFQSNGKDEKQLLQRRSIGAVEDLAKTDQRCAGLFEQFDADPWKLNTEGGVVDLKTGEIERHSLNHLMTKRTNGRARGDCPRWKKFILDVTGGDVELAAFLQRMIGYCITGSTQEHALFFLYGSGGNGKSVFCNVLADVLGDYVTTAGVETFTETKYGSHPAELAMLRGARIVLATETEEGHHWAESKIKRLTGGDPITACFKYANPFTFQPIFKLLVSGNHKPALRRVDDAIRRRLHIVPFTVTVPPEKRNLNLQAELLEERDGILAWCIEGCLQWQQQGLNPPGSVRGATDDYLSAQDSFRQWLEEYCELEPTNWEPPQLLFNSWKKWAIAAGENPGTQKQFADRLVSEGFAKVTVHGNQRYKGIGLKPEPPEAFRIPYAD